MTKGERIKEARRKKGLTQEDLGKLCDTSKQNIYKYETGKITNIPSDMLEKLANALGVTPFYLMGWEDDKKEDPIPEDEVSAKKKAVHEFVDGLTDQECERLLVALSALFPSKQ